MRRNSDREKIILKLRIDLGVGLLDATKAVFKYKTYEEAKKYLQSYDHKFRS